MPEANDAATAWHWLLERRPGTRGAVDDELVAVVAAAYAIPGLRGFYPFPTHGTLHFLRSAPPLLADGDDLPFTLYGGPPFKVYSSRYAALLGEAATAGEALSLVLANLPADLATCRPASNPQVKVYGGEIPAS